jgi:class 3 adenylate cyclase
LRLGAQQGSKATQLIGDHAAMEIIGFHDTVVRNALTVTKGREIKHTGDGIMASFSAADAAVICAARIQTDLVAQGFERGGMRLRIRIGAAAGEPVERHSDLFGSTVQRAARLCAIAEPTRYWFRRRSSNCANARTCRFSITAPSR